MRGMLLGAIATVTFVAISSASSPLPVQTRDATSLPTMGTASISGVVVDDQDPAQPVRRAVVTLTGEGLRPHRGAITDDEGRFAIASLPAGRFMLTAERAGYVTSAYGARRPGQPGTPLTIEDGRHVPDLRVRVWRGAVISGVLRDASGEPLVHAPVTAIPARGIESGTLTLSNRDVARTNDLGEYRIYGLEPGTYFIRAGSERMGTPERAASEAAIDAIFAALASRDQRAAGSPAAAGLVEPEWTILTTAPIYFPGTAAPAEATPIAVDVGEERRAIDFTVSRIQVASLHGAVVGPDGSPVGSAFVQLASDTRSQVSLPGVEPVGINSAADGTFSLGSIPPGTYRLLIRGVARSLAATGDAFTAGPYWWTSMPVNVTGSEIDLGSLPLRPGMKVSGRAAFNGDAPPPATLSDIRVSFLAESLAQVPTQGRGRGTVTNSRFLRPAIVNADGSFEVTDLIPDEYRLVASGPTLDQGGWWLRSALLDGRDLLDIPLRVAPDENVEGVTLVFSNRRTELSGTIATSSGVAVSELFVLAYPADPALRTPRSRRVAAVRPDNSGRFVIDNLPPGDYLLAALSDVDEGEWDDPAFFEPLIAASVRLTLADGERKVQDLRIGG